MTSDATGVRTRGRDITSFFGVATGGEGIDRVSPHDTIEGEGFLLPKPIGAPDETTGSGASADNGTATRGINRVSREAIRIRPGKPAKRRFIPLQQWEGVVTEVDDNSVYGTLSDLTNLSNGEELVELPIDDIPEADRILLVAGAVFYWSIGYEQSSSGQHRRISEIRMRRLPEWTQRKLDAVIESAKELHNRITERAEDGVAEG